MKKRSNWKVMARMIQLVRPLTGFMALAVLMGLIGHFCAAFITILGGYALLDAMKAGAGISMVLAFVLAGVFALIRGALRYGEQGCNHFIAFKLLALIREKVFRALRKLCPAKLECKEKGNLIAVITSDIELLEVFYAHTISPILIAVLFCTGMSVYIGSFHPALGLLSALAYLTIGGVLPILISRASGESGARFRAKSGALSSFVLCSLRGLSETIQYGQGKVRLAQMNARTDTLSKEDEKMKQRAGKNSALASMLMVVFDLAMLASCVHLYQLGKVNFAGVLLPVLAMMSSFGPAAALAGLGSTLQNTFAAGNRVLDILDESPAVDEITGQEEAAFAGAALEHVDFAYEDEKILDDVSLSIPAHQVIGLVGKSGSGKSTLLKLLMRFWKTEKGRITLSGKNIEAINTKNLRDMESFVTQETHLFRDSIANNLRIAKQDATEEELVAACQKASVHDFIMALPKGYDTPVGELGDTLSGGERQRLGLARAFLHDAPLMLLDEPTSNLDSLNEAVILRSLKEERADKTVVLVSHRKSTMRIADQVYSVENGRMS